MNTFRLKSMKRKKYRNMKNKFLFLFDNFLLSFIFDRSDLIQKFATNSQEIRV